MENYIAIVKSTDGKLDKYQDFSVEADADALENSWDKLRTERNSLLVSSDWTQAADSPLTDEVKAEWAVHREALRDLPANTPDPANPTWPDAPE